MRINRCTNLSFTGIAATPLIYGYLYGSFFQDHPGPMSRPYTAVNLRSCHTRLQTELVPPPVFRYEHVFLVNVRDMSSTHRLTDSSAAVVTRTKVETQNFWVEIRISASFSRIFVDFRPFVPGRESTPHQLRCAVHGKKSHQQTTGTTRAFPKCSPVADM